MVDPHFTRPSWLAGLPLPFMRINPDLAAIRYALQRVGIEKLEAVLLTHTHYDHALDAPAVARRCGAQLVGSESAVNLGRGAGMPEDRLFTVFPGKPTPFGSFIATFIESRHLPFPRWASRWVGAGLEIEMPLTPPARIDAYKPGKVYGLLLQHNLGRLLVLGSAGFIEGSLKNTPVDVVVLSVGGLDFHGKSYCTTFYQESVQVTGAKRVLLSHWDDFTRPIARPFKVMSKTRRSLERLQNFALKVDHPIIPIEVLQGWKKTNIFSGAVQFFEKGGVI